MADYRKLMEQPELLQYRSRFKLGALADSRPRLSLGLVESIDGGTSLDDSRGRIERRQDEFY